MIELIQINLLSSSVAFLFLFTTLLGLLKLVVNFFNYRKYPNSDFEVYLNKLFLVITLSIAEWSTIINTLSYLGFRQGWEIHMVNEGLIFSYAFFALFNFIFFNYLWRRS